MGGEYLFKLECQGLRLLAERKSPVKCSVRAITQHIWRGGTNRTCTLVG